VGGTTDEAASARLGRRGVLIGGVAAAAGAGAAMLEGSAGAGAQTPPADSVFNVKDYGATGGFWLNDTAAVQATIDAALAAGAGIVWFPAGAYRLTTSLKLNGSSFNVFDKPITLQGVGDASVLYATNDTAGTDPNWVFVGNSLIEARGQDGTKVTLEAAAPKGTRQLVVPTTLASTLSIGSIVAIEENITSGWVFGTDGKPLEMHKVVSLSGTTIDLDSPLIYGYTGAAQVYKVTPVQGIRIRDLAVTSTWDPVTRAGVYSIRLGRAANPVIERVRIFNAAGGILLTNVVDAHVSDCTIDGLPRYADSAGYGVAVEGPSWNVSVTGLVGRATRHLFTTLQAPGSYGGPRDVTVVGGIGEGGDVRANGEGPLAIWDTHAAGNRISFIGCSATGVGMPGNSGFQVRAKQVRIIDCVAKYNSLRGIAIVPGEADDVTISGGEVAYNGECGITAGGNTTVTGVEVHHNGQRGVNWNGASRVLVTNCYIHDNVNEGVRDQAAAGSKAGTVVVTGNIIPKGSGSWPQPNSTHGLGGTNAVFANNVVRGYGATNDGTAGFEAGVVKQNNVTGP